MYRRLDHVSYTLEELGLQHIRNYEMMLRRLTYNADIQALKTLADLVEPIEDYKRHRFNPDRKYLSYSPLTRLVDAVQSDALEARNFRKTVVDYLKQWSELNISSEGLKGRKRKRSFKRLRNSPVQLEISTKLNIWQTNHQSLNPIIDSSPILKEIESLSSDLSQAAEIGFAAIGFLEEGKTASENWTNDQLSILEKAMEPKAELELRIVPAIADLVRVAGNRPNKAEDE
ncbi:MAG: hypothetical protein H8E14_16820 [Candidatus Marinimicrobia bacterium]|nr:hypothetical protein [Candidatus Neomarinimicrobiota bacterium]